MGGITSGPPTPTSIMSADSTQRGVEAGMMARTASPAVIVLSPVEAHGDGRP